MGSFVRRVKDDPILAQMSLFASLFSVMYLIKRADIITTNKIIMIISIIIIITKMIIIKIVIAIVMIIF